MDELDETPSYVKEEKPVVFPKELIENPLKYISNYYESIYPHMGKKVFQLLCLVPVSLIIPKIPRGRKSIKQKINFLLISAPGTAKTSIAEEFEKITFNPLFVEHITNARLEREIKDNNLKQVSIIISDISTIFSNEESVKMLEGILGDEGVIGRNTMRNIREEKRKKIDVVSYLSGTPENIVKEILGWGMLSRTSPLLITHSEEEHDDILDFINDEMGVEYDSNENIIPKYYQELFKIQNGERDMRPITGYIIPKEIKDNIRVFIKPLVKPAFLKWGVNAVRETEETYRFLVNHACLNIYNREIRDGKIVIEEGDLKVAKYLIKREVRTKEFIIGCINTLNTNNIKTIKQLQEWTARNRINDRATQMVMRGVVKK